jgi:hypothetical protein
MDFSVVGTHEGLNLILGFILTVQSAVNQTCAPGAIVTFIF